LVVLGFQGLMLARQAFYTSPYVLSIFNIGSPELFVWAGFKLPSS
jgi:hypothetical protein